MKKLNYMYLLCLSSPIETVISLIPMDSAKGELYAFETLSPDTAHDIVEQALNQKFKYKKIK